MHRHNGENMRCMKVEPPVHEPVDPSSPQDHLLPAKLRNASAARGGWAKCSNNCKKLQLVKDTNMSQESYLNFCRSRLFFNKRALRKNKMGGCVEQNMGMTVQKRRVTGLKQFRLTELRARIPNMPSLCSRKALHCFISVCWVLLSTVEYCWVLVSTVECCSLLCFNQNIKYEVELQR